MWGFIGKMWCGVLACVAVLWRAVFGVVLGCRLWCVVRLCVALDVCGYLHTATECGVCLRLAPCSCGSLWVAVCGSVYVEVVW